MGFYAYNYITENDWSEVLKPELKIPSENCCSKLICKDEICNNFKNCIECQGHVCENQKMRKKEWKRVKIEKTARCGFGLFANEPISEGSFIIEYVGKIKLDFGDERLKVYRYGFTLAENIILDSANSGNEARFINHGCDPNAIYQIWTSRGLPSLAIFALRDIEEGEEIKMSYELDTILGSERCLCGSKNCSTMLGVSPRDAIHRSDMGKYRQAGKPKKSNFKKSVKLSSRLLYRAEVFIKDKLENLNTENPYKSHKNDKI